MSDLKLVSKLDSELTNSELHGIFQIYNECFYDSQVQDQITTLKVKKWLGHSKTFKWYLLKKSGYLVAMASYIYSYDRIGEFDINSEPAIGENLCNVAVRKKYQGKGYASQVLKALMNDHQQQVANGFRTNPRLVLEIKKDNDQYVRLENWYRSLKFETLVENDHQLYLVYEKKIDRRHL